jgi:uncharacterized membrane protein
MVVGVVSSAARARSAEVAQRFMSVADVMAALWRRPFNAEAIAALGFITLCVTPFAAVMTAALAFSLEGDRQFTVICLLIAAALLLGFSLGVA